MHLDPSWGTKLIPKCSMYEFLYNSKGTYRAAHLCRQHPNAVRRIANKIKPNAQYLDMVLYDIL